MAVPQDKQELLDAIRTTYQKLVAALARVPPERTREATLAGHAQGTRVALAVKAVQSCNGRSIWAYARLAAVDCTKACRPRRWWFVSCTSRRTVRRRVARPCRCSNL
ncbi:hypothetical protein CAL22_11965 [Bordetella genomosp. 12]|uniref:Uncharacterized protein n=1 Tax=Bordetella genomosp. 12 TaxID=463035 RepID=A0A261VLW9_9BORD|nr:hypothetical protein CAL22_11965 [Bordetella genomosp. 12]